MHDFHLHSYCPFFVHYISPPSALIFFVNEMSTSITSVATIKLLVKEISTLSTSLLDSAAPSSLLEVKESDELETASTGRDSRVGDEELEIEEFSWDGLVIEDEDEEDVYWHGSQSE